LKFAFRALPASAAWRIACATWRPRCRKVPVLGQVEGMKISQARQQIRNQSRPIAVDRIDSGRCHRSVGVEYPMPTYCGGNSNVIRLTPRNLPSGIKKIIRLADTELPYSSYEWAEYLALMDEAFIAQPAGFA
jgi:hypothetical protein